jgi:uncharacterized protein DUF5666
MKSRFGVILGLVTLALMLVTAAWARESAGTELIGRVTSIDSLANAFTVETATGSIVLKTTLQTVFAQQAQMSDLRVGDQVRVRYEGEGPNRTATQVSIINPRSNQGPSATYEATAGGETVTGRVTSVDIPARTIAIEGPTGVRSFQVENEAQIVSRGGSSLLEDVKIGDRVRIQPAHGSSTIAGRIEFLPGPEQRAASRLPGTASSLPLLGISVLLLLGAALTLRTFRRDSF